MRRVLEELWRGNISPMDKKFQRGSDFDESLGCMVKNEEKLNAMLEGKELETFEKYKEAVEEVEQFNEEDAFITGFRLGARLMMEAFSEDDGFFTSLNE